ncbi:hypothetical protein SY88_09720 [Clostridiales bacterium PH28_bin88]|nr:hypothetical protein SY88_09720 [Clostridiales bacterium PH28_bin88]
MAFSIDWGELVLYDSFNIEQVAECWSGLKGLGLQTLLMLNLRNLQSMDLAGLQVVLLILRECPNIQVLLPVNSELHSLLTSIGVKEGDG